MNLKLKPIFEFRILFHIRRTYVMYAIYKDRYFYPWVVHDWILQSDPIRVNPFEIALSDCTAPSFASTQGAVQTYREGFFSFDPTNWAYNIVGHTLSLGIHHIVCPIIVLSRCVALF